MTKCVEPKLYVTTCTCISFLYKHNLYNKKIPVIFFLGVRRKDGEEYEPGTLTGVQNSIDRHLKDNKSKIDIKKDKLFDHSRKILETKRKELKGQGKGNKKNRAEAVEPEDVKLLYNKQILGAGTSIL